MTLGPTNENSQEGVTLNTGFDDSDNNGEKSAHEYDLSKEYFGGGNSGDNNSPPNAIAPGEFSDQLRNYRQEVLENARGSHVETAEPAGEIDAAEGESDSGEGE